MYFHQLSRALLFHGQTASSILRHHSSQTTTLGRLRVKSITESHRATALPPLSSRNSSRARPDRIPTRSYWEQKKKTYQDPSEATMVDQHQRVDIELVFDFDGTITTEDTIESLVNAAIDIQVTRGVSRDRLVSAWDHIVQSYAEDLDHHNHTYVAPDGRPPVRPLDIAMAQLWPIRHLEEPIQVLLDRYSGRQRRHVELASLARLKDEGLFRGIGPDDLLRAGQSDRAEPRVYIREGFDWFFGQARLQNHDTHILSVNWSADYIKGVLGTNFDMTSIIANKTNPDDGSISALGVFEEHNDEELWPDILTVANDKLVALQNLYWKRKAFKPEKELIFIYFGDSTTDIECLMEVGGVIMADDEGQLLRLLRQEIDYHVPHVSEWEEGGFTCWARNFRELLEYAYLTRRVMAAENHARQRSLVDQ